jgi:hypothetical protein
VGGRESEGIDTLDSWKSTLCLCFRDGEGRMRGVELALDGAEASLLTLLSDGANEGLVGVLAMKDEESFSISWLALMAFSSDAGVIELVNFRARGFCTRLLVPAEDEVAGWVRSDGQAHSEAKSESQSGRM